MNKGFFSSDTWRRIQTLVLLGSVFFLAAVSILFIRENRQLQVKLSQLTPPHRTGPIQFDFQSFASLAGLLSPSGGGPPRKRLLMIWGADCEYSRDNLENWNQLAAEIDWSQGQEAVLVTLGGPAPASLANALNAAGAPYRTGTPPDLIQFALQSGIGQTPFTLLLEADGSVSFACLGKLGRPEMDLFRDAANGKSLSSRDPDLLSRSYAGSTKILGNPQSADTSQSH